jgi:hypothetical protein
LLGGVGVGLILPAFTALAAATLPPARLATGIGVQTTFRQIGAALGLAAFVAIAGGTTLATKADYDGAWLFMAAASAGSSIVLSPLLVRESRATPAAATAPIAAIPTVPSRRSRALSDRSSCSAPGALLARAMLEGERGCELLDRCRLGGEDDLLAAQVSRTGGRS